MTQLQTIDISQLGIPIRVENFVERGHRLSEERKNRTGFFDALDASFQTGFTSDVISRVFEELAFPRDESFLMTQKLWDQLIVGIPTEYIDEFDRADSEQEAFFIRKELLAHIRNTEIIQRAGGFSRGSANLIATVGDPVILAVAMVATLLAVRRLRNRVAALRCKWREGTVENIFLDRAYRKKLAEDRDDVMAKTVRNQKE